MHARCVARIKSTGKFLRLSVVSSRYEQENRDNVPRDEYNAIGIRIGIRNIRVV